MFPGSRFKNRAVLINLITQPLQLLTIAGETELKFQDLTKLLDIMKCLKVFFFSVVSCILYADDIVLSVSLPVLQNVTQ